MKKEFYINKFDETKYCLSLGHNHNVCSCNIITCTKQELVQLKNKLNKLKWLKDPECTCSENTCLHCNIRNGD